LIDAWGWGGEGSAADVARPEPVGRRTYTGSATASSQSPVSERKLDIHSRRNNGRRKT
jgi:hypothetical protein